MRRPAGRPQPGNADTITALKTLGRRAAAVDGTHHLVAWNHLGALRRQLCLDDVEIGPADATGLDPHTDFIRRRFRNGNVEQTQRRAFDPPRL